MKRRKDLRKKVKDLRRRLPMKVEKAAAPAPQPETHALVPVTRGTNTAVAALRNSATHKKEWDVFSKQLKTNTKAPAALSEYAVTKTAKIDLFNMWLDCGEDWDECAVELERRQERKTQAVKGWEAVQGRVLRQRYKKDPAKFDALVAKRKEMGLWYADDVFPDDLDESWSNYFKTKGSLLTNSKVLLNARWLFNISSRNPLPEHFLCLVQPIIGPQPQSSSA